MNSTEAANLPWRDLTKEWNAALEDYRKRTGGHRHGTLRGSRSPDFPKGMDNKHCAILVVVDRFMGEPIKLDLALSTNPDWWDLHKIIAQPYDVLFRGVKGGMVGIDDHLGSHVRRLVDLHNASLAK